VKPRQGASTRLGKEAEAAAAHFLEAAGYTILWRNVRFGPLELDLIAQCGNLAIVVEVRRRGRGALQGALESVGGLKRRRLLIATDRLFRERLSKMPSVQRVRIDVIAVYDATASDTGSIVNGFRIEHIQGAITG
jgi:Holliday junction resolvase-like predicted endonuclease